MSLPRVALTVGDPAGIGPEIVTKAAQHPRVRAVCEPIIFDVSPGLSIQHGVLSAEAGRAAYDVIVKAVGAARAGDIDAIATAPVNKLAFAQAGLPWKGHTDLLAHLCGVERVAMMFYSAKLLVVLATVHVPIAQVPSLLTEERLFDTISLTAAWMPRFGIPAARIAVAGLNPHAGEAGLIGDEDELVVRPAVTRARGRGIDATGPWPADTVFTRAMRGEFDVVVACYHDQGLIPIKVVAFGQAVNVTIGLPIIRTSVDHGTAFDIAGRGVADAGSMVEAVVLAAHLARGPRSVL
ncbi:MAG: 4-hydroxythreonine-4-phosphate dehydrogenase PdxA [Acidobacteria bacterium]|nr:4-hydroxythreonine-4-phosphate dehydrogenase PdxA [Acidobacteriota bacterium]